MLHVWHVEHGTGAGSRPSKQGGGRGAGSRGQKRKGARSSAPECGAQTWRRRGRRRGRRGWRQYAPLVGRQEKAGCRSLPPLPCLSSASLIYIYIYIYIYICNPGHRVSRPRGTGAVGDSVGEGHRERERERERERACSGMPGACPSGQPPSLSFRPVIPGPSLSCPCPFSLRILSLHRPRLQYQLLTLCPAASSGP